MSRGIGSLYRYSSGLLMHGNVRVLALTGLLTGTYVSMLNTALQPFAVSLGLGLTSLGFMQALGNRVGGFSGAIIQPFAGRLADTHGRRKVIVGGSLVSISSMASFLAAAITNAWPLLIPGFLLLGFSLLSSPASQAILAESVRMEPRKMRIVFSWVFFFNSIPGAVMAFVAGVIVDTIGYYLVFALAVALESVNLLLYLTRLGETRESSLRGEARRDAPTLTLRNVIEPPKGLRGFFATFATDAFSFGMTGSIIYGMMVKQFGYSGTEVGLVVGTLYLAVVAAQYPAARILLRFGSKKSLALSEFLSVLLLVGWNVSTSLPYFILLSVLFGVAIAAWVPAQQSMLMALAPPEGRGALAGKLAAFTGLIAFPAPILGGFLFDTLGYHAPVTLSVVGIALALSMIIRLLPDERERVRQPAA
ncbi:MAG: MFS transporter [Thaumarchaeota archaeon]|nr:MAG: MFS transporter [Nitrososphaerota archaeon]